MKNARLASHLSDQRLFNFYLQSMFLLLMLSSNCIPYSFSLIQEALGNTQQNLSKNIFLSQIYVRKNLYLPLLAERKSSKSSETFQICCACSPHPRPHCHTINIIIIIIIVAPKPKSPITYGNFQIC